MEREASEGLKLLWKKGEMDGWEWRHERTIEWMEKSSNDAGRDSGPGSAGTGHGKQMPGHL